MASLQVMAISLGKRDSLAVRGCNAGRVSGATESSETSTWRVCILRACFWRFLHSAFVGILWKDFREQKLDEESMRVTNELTRASSSAFQTSCGRHFSNGVSLSCLRHSASNTGSPKSLQQHANETAVALAPDSTSLRATSLVVSLTLRQGCISIQDGTLAKYHQGL